MISGPLVAFVVTPIAQPASPCNKKAGAKGETADKGDNHDGAVFEADPWNAEFLETGRDRIWRVVSGLRWRRRRSAVGGRQRWADGRGFGTWGA